MNTINKQQGMTLVELMIAGALGVLVTFFIMNIMITSGRTAIQSEGWLKPRRMAGFFSAGYITKGAGPVLGPVSAIHASSQLLICFPPAAHCRPPMGVTVPLKATTRFRIVWPFAAPTLMKFVSGWIVPAPI